MKLLDLCVMALSTCCTLPTGEPRMVASEADRTLSLGAELRNISAVLEVLHMSSDLPLFSFNPYSLAMRSTVVRSCRVSSTLPPSVKAGS